MKTCNETILLSIFNATLPPVLKELFEQEVELYTVRGRVHTYRVLKEFIEKYDRYPEILATLTLVGSREDCDRDFIVENLDISYITMLETLETSVEGSASESLVNVSDAIIDKIGKLEKGEFKTMVLKASEDMNVNLIRAAHTVGNLLNILPLIKCASVYCISRRPELEDDISDALDQ